MTNLKTCTIKILNTTYQIKCPESEEEQLYLVADKINEKIAANKQQFKQLDNFHTLLLATLDIGHELIICKNEQEHQRHQVNQFITSLENKINKTVGSDVYNIPATD